MRAGILPSLIRQYRHHRQHADIVLLSRGSFDAAHFSVAGSPSGADSSHAVAALNAVLRVASTRRRATSHAMLISGSDGDVATLYDAAANELLAEDGLPRFLRWSLLADTISVFGQRARLLERRGSGSNSSLDGSDGAKAALASSVAAAAISRAAALTHTSRRICILLDVHVCADSSQIRYRY